MPMSAAGRESALRSALPARPGRRRQGQRTWPPYPAPVNSPLPQPRRIAMLTPSGNASESMPDHAEGLGGAQDYVGDPRNDSALVSINGELTRREEAKVSAFDSGFVLG